jgi:hypothetical protein
MRKYLSFVLLGVLTVVGLGAAVLGVAQSKSGVALGQAVTNTLNSPNYTEDLVEHTPQGDQTATFVYQAPDRLGGWIRSSAGQIFVVVIGSTEYASVTQPLKDNRIPKKFFTQKGPPAKTVDPAHRYLPFWKQGPSTRSGSVTKVKLTQSGQTVNLTYTVSGNYVSRFTAAGTGSTIDLDISKIGTSPPVALPAGATSKPATAQPQG